MQMVVNGIRQDLFEEMHDVPPCVTGTLVACAAGLTPQLSGPNTPKTKT